MTALDKKQQMQTISELIDSLVEFTGPVLLQPGSTDTVSYAGEELHSKISQLARGLIEKGLSSGDRVVVSGPATPAWIIVVMAVIRAGGQAVPLDDQTPAAEVQHIFEDCEPEFVFLSAEKLEILREAEIQFPDSLYLLDNQSDEIAKWDSLQSSKPLVEVDSSPQTTVMLFYTSGTTGIPKGVPLTSNNLLSSVRAIEAAGLARAGDRMLIPLPFHHVYPFVIGLLTPFYLQIPLILPEAQTGPAIAQALYQGDASIVVGVPRLYRALFEAINDKLSNLPVGLNWLMQGLLKLSYFLRRRLSLRVGKQLLFLFHRKFAPNLRLLASGGSPLDQNLAWSLEALGWKVAIGYGLTETSPLLTLMLPRHARFDTVGRPLPDVELKIVDSSDQQPELEEGEVLARGPNVFSEYYNLPDETEKAFVDGDWFRTGDIGKLDSENFLVLEGRASTMIVTEAGKNIHPDQLEDFYQQHSFIEEIGILQFEGKLVGLVVPDLEEIRQQGENDPRLAINTVLKELARDLPSYKRLNDFQLSRDELPRTRLGKLRRHLLAERYGEISSGETAEKSRGKPVEIFELSSDDQKLLDDPDSRAVWDWLTEKYSDYSLTFSSNFQFDLNVDSLEWVNLTLKISQLTGIDLSEEKILQIETVRQLFETLDQVRTEDAKRVNKRIFAQPEAVLGEDKLRWLQPRPLPLKILRRMLYWLNRGTVGQLFWVRSSGLENLPESGNFVLAPNHLSYLDPFVLAAVLDYSTLSQTYWAAWQGVAFNNPLVRLFSRTAGAVPIDPLQSLVSSLAYGSAVLQRGNNLVWFPEGRRSPDGKIQKFRLGLGLLLSNLSVPVVPVYINGTYEALPRGNFLPRPRPTYVRFGRPLNPNSLLGDKSDKQGYQLLMDKLQEAVEQLARDN